ncbi:family 14 glycosylhydrolase [Solicola sp. PLA-1-18]|uniref:family 14 glycosylhydrolase n=1 Tax=Solicola sp. PLA-1-18 TaxID=3380532 RepID=UPI003B7B6586
MRRSPAVLAVLSTVLALVGLNAPAQATGRGHDHHASRAGFTANVMAPLKVTDWADFTADLRRVKAYGVQAVSVDVWWGDVEKAGDNRFDWSYYDRVFDVVTDEGLDLAPILSFHQCGGNVGDDYTSLLPSWLWAKYDGRRLDGVTLDADGLKHRSEQGNVSAETVQGWADELVLGEYRDFTKAFAQRYGRTLRRDVVEVNVSLGPSGELRYPSYNAHDTGTGYPTRGALQAYSPLAVADFRADTIDRYGSLRRVNRAWGTAYRSVRQIAPPADAESFFADGTYSRTRYGRDFVDWYNGSLAEHGERMLTTVATALGRTFPRADLGYKVPGVHWTMTNPAFPRAAEVTSGLISGIGPRRGHGYARFVALARQVQRETGRHSVMHFTCLEMMDQDVAPQYSLAQTLVGWVGDEATRQRVDLKGENALAGGVYSDEGWDNITSAVDDHGYDGLTVLRVGDVADGVGARRYAALIAAQTP